MIAYVVEVAFATLLQSAPASVDTCHWVLVTTPVAPVMNVAGSPF